MSNFSIIDNTKENTEGELIIFLFELCNLSCQMCYQDHDSVVGIDNVVEKFEVVAQAIDAIKLRGKTAISINLMGGELFADNLDDKLFDDYLVLIAKIREYAEAVDITINMQIASNFVWEKTERVRNFLDKANIELAASWDPVGRFNARTLAIFKKNIVEFKDDIVQVGIVMTKPTIVSFMEKTPDFFDYLYENFTIVFDHYTPDTVEKHVDHLLPTDVILRDFYKFMLDNWPDCHPFIETRSKLKQPMFCMGTMNVFPNATISSCQTYEVKEAVVHFGALNKNKEQWFKEYDCMSCEYMQRCSFGCFLNNHNKKSRTQEVCWLKEVYDYVESK